MLHGEEAGYDLSEHVHAHLSIFVDGVNVPIPTDIGVAAEGIVANPHTHGSDGVLHVHPLTDEPLPEYPDLEDFFAAWRTQSELIGNNPAATFSANELMGNIVDDEHIIRMYVNGEANDEFEEFQPDNGDQIVLSYERLPEPGAPLLRPISNATFPAGQTLHLPLVTVDADGDAIDYEVTSSDSAVTAEVLTDGSTLELIVTGLDGEGEPFTGRLVYRLFDTLAPKTVARIKELVSLGFYDGLTFHRVIKDFMLQGGDPSGDGRGGSGVDFDDEYDPSLTFNGFGQLAMAKSSDDTNDSQFFTTDLNLSFNISADEAPLPPQHLNFNHTIFGQLVDGFETYHRMITTSVDGSVPDVPLTIVSARLIDNDQLGVLRVSAPRGFASTAEITVTATDTSGNADTQAFVVDVIPPTQNNNPFLGTIEDIRAEAGRATSITIPVTDIDGDLVNVGFSLAAVGPIKAGATIESLIDVVVTPDVISPTGIGGTATLTVTPTRDFAGQAELFLFIHNEGVSPSQATADIQVVPITVTPAAPTRVALAEASDTGRNKADLITALRNDPSSRMEFVVEGVLEGAEVTILVDGTPIGTGTATSGSVSILTDGTRPLADGLHSLTARQSFDGLESGTTTPVVLVTDTTPLAFAGEPPASVTVGGAYVFDAGVDEVEAGQVTYRLETRPAGMTIAPDTGVVTWSPSAAQAGLNSVAIVATDRAGNESVQAFTITAVAAVGEVPASDPPASGPVLPAISFAASRLEFEVPFTELAPRLANPIQLPQTDGPRTDLIRVASIDRAVTPIYGSGSLRLGSIEQEAERENERDQFFFDAEMSRSESPEEADFQSRANRRGAERNDRRQERILMLEGDSEAIDETVADAVADAVAKAVADAERSDGDEA